jgi:hypothetical protein
MAFQCVGIYEDPFGFNAASGVYVVVLKAGVDFAAGVGEILIKYFANKAAQVDGKPAIVDETYQITGEALGVYLARMVELGGDLYTPAYEYLRTVTNPDGSLKFPPNQWIDVED